MIRILVVDDEIAILDEIAETLTEEGYGAVCVERVDAALDALRNHSDINLVVTDLKMPGKTGANLINQARAEFERDITFLVMSGHGSPEVDPNGLKISEYPFLKKPLDVDQLLKAVAKAVTQNQDGR
ncbi:MAG TPA: response regulator [Porticoccus sp.]|nr:response regulator [Porticoccus sp.]